MRPEHNIKLIIMDVDGVLTDGKITYGSDGTEYKSFNVKDGLGINLARSINVKFAIITGRSSDIVDRRAEELQIDFVYQGIKDKKEIFTSLIQSLNIEKNEVCFIGDDLNDLPLIKEVGTTFAPRDASELVKEKVNHVTKANGGEGAVREMIEKIFSNNSNYQNIIETYLEHKNYITQ